MIIAVDYDGTLESGGEMNVVLAERLKARQRCGDIVILWTFREGDSLRSALANLYQIGLIPNAVNENAPQAIRMLGRNPRKIYADVYIDDKAMR